MNTYTWNVRVQQIEDHARSILRELSVTEPPVPVRKIAEHLSIRVRPSTFDEGVSGILVLNGDTPTIGYNVTNSPVRRRFSIAHEIGHYVLHSDESNLFIDKGYNKVFYRDKRSSEGKYRRELEANAFAAALLMPTDMVEHEITNQGFDLAEEDSLEELARKFEVSRQAMAYRLANSGIFSTAPEHL